MASRTVKLTLTVKYFYEDGRSIPDAALCEGQLRDIVVAAANRGQLSGDSDLCVDDYRYQVETIATEN
jgi:hypothetical protein